mgnify:CR=1 FL=1
MLSIDDKRPAPPVPEPFNLSHHVLFANGATDDKIAMAILSASQVERWCYGRLRQAVMKTAGGLLASGLGPGDTVMMRLGNTPDFPVIFLAAIAAGIVPVPTSASLGTAEITRIARLLRPAALIAGQNVALPEGHYKTVTPEALLTRPPLNQPEQTSADDLAYIVFTSGTSGSPLGVKHAHRAMWARGRMKEGWYGLRPDDRLIHAGAFNWTYTLGTGLLDPWSIGATALVLGNGTSLDLLPILARRHEATIIAGAPGIFRKMLKQDIGSLPRLRHALSAGEKLPDTVRQEWCEKTGTYIYEAFGQSECSTFISGSPARPAPAGTLGYTQPGRAVAVLGQDGPVPRGDIGQIAIHASDHGLALGYLNEEASACEEWVLTGDMGVMREDGAVEYHGRADDILTAGGFRISPLEIETAMEACNGVEEAAAVDLQISPDTKIVALYYTSRTPVAEDVLAKHAKMHLARYKRPRAFFFRETLPRGANGKLLRRELRAGNEDAS